MFDGMRERNFETSVANYELAHALVVWKRWPDSPMGTEGISKLLETNLQRGPVEIKLRGDVLDNSHFHKFRTKKQALELGHVEGRFLVFDINSKDEKINKERRVNARVSQINGESFLVLETQVDKVFGFLKPEDIVSIKI